MPVAQMMLKPVFPASSASSVRRGQIDRGGYDQGLHAESPHLLKVVSADRDDLIMPAPGYSTSADGSPYSTNACPVHERPAELLRTDGPVTVLMLLLIFLPQASFDNNASRLMYECYYFL